MKSFAILAGAFSALVILLAGNLAEAKSCSECNALAGGAYRDCRATCDDTAPRRQVRPRKSDPQPVEEPTLIACPYYMGKQVKEGDCPEECPDGKMSIKDNICQCQEDMLLSANQKACMCAPGYVLEDDKCVEAKPDCEACTEFVNQKSAAVYQAMLTSWCSSESKYYKNKAEREKNCPVCPDGTVDTGMKCIPKAGKRGFWVWPFTCWDLFTWLLIAALIAGYFFYLRRKDKKSLDDRLAKFPKQSDLDELRGEVADVNNMMKAQEIADLENRMIPALQKELDAADRKLETANSAFGAHAEIRENLAKAVDDAEKKIGVQGERKDALSEQLDTLELVDNPTKDEKDQIAKIKGEKKDCLRNLQAARQQKAEAEKKLQEFDARSEKDLGSFQEAKDKAEANYRELLMKLEAVQKRADQLRA